MKTRIIMVSLFVCWIAIAAGQAKKITLQQAIDSALRNNLNTKQAQLQANAAQINYQQAKLNRLPQIQGNYDYGFNNGRSIDPFTNGYINQNITSSSVNATGSVPVFSGLQLSSAIKQNEYAFQTATMQWQQSKDELTLNVILAYLQILSNEDALVLARAQGDVSRQQVERLEIINKEGATPPANLSDLKGQYAGDKLSIITAENAVESSRISLVQLMSAQYDSTLEIDRTGFDSTIKMYDALPDDIYANALQKLASVKASEFKIKSNVMAVKVASSYLYPTLSVYGGLSTNYSSSATLNHLLNTVEVPSGDYVVVNGANSPVITKQSNFSSDKILYGKQLSNNLSSGYGLSLSVPIFSAFRTRSNIKLARNDEKISRVVADNIKVQLRQSIDQAFVNILSTYKRYHTLQEQVDAYAESFRIASIRFENGVINSPEYLIAKNNMDRANATLISTRYEYLLRSKVLDFYMGLLNNN